MNEENPPAMTFGNNEASKTFMEMLQSQTAPQVASPGADAEADLIIENFISNRGYAGYEK